MYLSAQEVTRRKMILRDEYFKSSSTMNIYTVNLYISKNDAQDRVSPCYVTGNF